MSLARCSVGAFHRKWMPTMLVPLLVVLPTNFVALWLIGAYAAERAQAFPHLDVGSLPGPWHLHLWFLIVLAVFTAMAPQLDGLAARAGRWLTRVPLAPVPLAVVLILAMVLISRGSLEVIARLTWPAIREDWLTFAQFAYLPSYLLGLLAWHHAGLREALMSPRPRDAGAWFAVVVAMLTVLAVAPMGGPARVLEEAAFALAMLGVLSYAFRLLVRERKPVIAFLSDAVYTVYLLHYLCIWAVFAALGGVIKSYWTLYGLAVAAGFGVPLLVHAYPVRRFELAGFLLNGRRPQARTAAPASAPAASPPELARAET